MISLSILSWFGVLQILIQFVAVYYSYRIFSFNRLNKGWLAMTVALFLMTFRRITALLIEMNFLSSFNGWVAAMDRIILPTLISIFLFVGLFVMLKNFENFDVVEKKVKKAVKKK